MSTKVVGERTVGICLSLLLQMEKVVLLPFGDNQRYDLVVDDGDGKFTRIQCKTARVNQGAIRFNTCSVNWHKKTKRSYAGDADVFMVYCPANRKVYWIPVGDVGEREACLRETPTKNGQSNGVRWAKTYEMTIP